MSAADEDTELRDLLIHTLENNGVLNKMKAELRASVFLALEEQERPDNKPTLVNERLRQFLNSGEGRLVAGLVTDFLSYFHLDFTLAVLQPEANLPGTADDRAHVAGELGLSEADKGGPLLLQLIRHLQHKQPALNGGLPELPGQELPPSHMLEAQDKFQLYDRDKNGEISKEELRLLLIDLFPHLHRDMLDTYINEEIIDLSSAIDIQHFLAMYKRLFIQCRSVQVSQEVSELIHPSSKLQLHTRTDTSSFTKSSDNHSAAILLKPQPKLDDLKLDEQENHEAKLDKEDLDEDSFFDDPIPKPQKIYGWKEETSKPSDSLSALLNSAADRSEPNSHSEAHINEGSLHSSLKDLKSASDKMASLDLGAGNEDEYADDFNSTSQRSDKSEVSIGEDLEEELSVDDFTGSDNKLEDFTMDNSISHISDVADFLEDVS